MQIVLQLTLIRYKMGTCILVDIIGIAHRNLFKSPLIESGIENYLKCDML